MSELIAYLTLEQADWEHRQAIDKAKHKYPHASDKELADVVAKANAITEQNRIVRERMETDRQLGMPSVGSMRVTVLLPPPSTDEETMDD